MTDVNNITPTSPDKGGKMSKIKTNLIFAAIAALVITGLQMYSIFHTPSARIENEYSYRIATALRSSINLTKEDSTRH